MSTSFGDDFFSWDRKKTDETRREIAELRNKKKGELKFKIDELVSQPSPFLTALCGEKPSRNRFFVAQNKYFAPKAVQVITGPVNVPVLAPVAIRPMLKSTTRGKKKNTSKFSLLFVFNAHFSFLCSQWSSMPTSLPQIRSKSREQRRQC